MKKHIASFYFCCFLLSLSGFSQNTFSPSLMADNESAMIELLVLSSDSISNYLYSDVAIVERCIQRCEAILETDIEIGVRDFIHFKTQRIYYDLNDENPIGALQVIKETEPFITHDSISARTKSTLRYIKGYTLMTLGDFEAAQETFYEELSNARMELDTGTIVSSLYSLGQLYRELEEYDGAKKCYYELIDLNEVYPLSSGTYSLVYYELGEVHQIEKDYSTAMIEVNKGLDFLVDEGLKEIESDMLLLKAELLINMNKIKEAEQVFSKVQILHDGAVSMSSQKSSDLFLGKLLTAKKSYASAANHYLRLLDRTDEADLLTRKRIYKELELVYHQLDNHDQAYAYLKKASEVQQTISDQDKVQDAAYLKAKFESEQKEKENLLLAAQVQEEKSNQRLLFLLVIISVLGILGLLGAYFQKQRYNSRLKQEVLSRTEELEASNAELLESNTELDEFNRILSHDLKEPLRSIVGFSSLAKKEVDDNPKLEEYLAYIENGGQQLHQIIEDVTRFKRLNNQMMQAPEVVKTELLVRDIESEVKQRLNKDNLEIHTKDLPSIKINKVLLDVIFRNLIENGTKYNQQIKPSLAISYRLKKGMHTFQFEDNGIGIASEYQDLIFQMFKRLHTRDVYTGSGLGLSIIRKMLHKVGGEIDLLRSAKGEGSVFEVYIPV